MSWGNYIADEAAQVQTVDGELVELPADYLIIGPLARCDAVFSPNTREEFRLRPGEVERLIRAGVLRKR